MIDWQASIVAFHRIPLTEWVSMIIVPFYWIGMLPIFLLISAFRGMARTERISRTNSRTLPRFILEYGYWQFRLPIGLFKRLHITPDMLTWTSLALAACSGYCFAIGHVAAGGLFLTFSSSCDAFDGIMARETGVSSDRGEYFDSVVDRYSDFLVSFGLLWYYRDIPWMALVMMAVIIGSQVMGYAKAKGEIMGIDPKVGFMQRHERCVYILSTAGVSPIGAALFEPQAVHPTYHILAAALVLVAILTNVTSIWRAVYVLRRMPRAAAGPAADAPAAVTPEGKVP